MRVGRDGAQPGVVGWNPFGKKHIPIPEFSLKIPNL